MGRSQVVPQPGGLRPQSQGEPGPRPERTGGGGVDRQAPEQCEGAGRRWGHQP